MTTRVTSKDLQTLPWRMLPLAKDYVRLASAEGKEAGALARSAMLSLGEDLALGNIDRWEEVKPAHYEAWLRRREERVSVGTADAKAEFANQHFRTREFFEMIEEKGVRLDNPAATYAVKQDGAVFKYGDANPALDEPIAEFIKSSGLDGTPSGNALRSNLRSMAGALLARGVRQWRDVTTTHVELIARDWVEQGKAAGKPSAATIQNRIRAARLFFDVQVENGKMAGNPAEDVVATKRGRVTTLRDLNPEMFDQAQSFVDAQKGSTPATQVTMTAVVNRFTGFVCGECGVQTWAEVTPAHYEEYLRTAWGRNYRHPANAMFQQSTSKKLLSNLKDRGLTKIDPSEGYRFTMSGEMHTPRRRKPDLLPEQYTEVTKSALLQDVVPAGFNKEMDGFLERTVTSRKVGTVIRAKQTLPELADFVATTKGRKDWQGVTREDLVAYANDIHSRLSINTAVNKFSAVRLFFNDLHEFGKVAGHPVYGIQMTYANGVEVKDAPTLEMEEQIGRHTRTLSPQARLDRWERLFEVGAQLTKMGKTAWADVNPETLTNALRTTAATADYSQDESKAMLSAQRAFFKAMKEQREVPVDAARKVALDEIWSRKPRSPSVPTPDMEESTCIAVGLMPPTVAEPSKLAAPGPILDNGCD